MKIITIFISLFIVKSYKYIILQTQLFVYLVKDIFITITYGIYKLLLKQLVARLYSVGIINWSINSLFVHESYCFNELIQQFSSIIITLYDT